MSHHFKIIIVLVLVRLLKKFVKNAFFKKKLCIYVAFWRATCLASGSSPAKGAIGAPAASIHHSHSNTGSLSHWARPGIEPTSSWIVVGLITAQPQWELLSLAFLTLPHDMATKKVGAVITPQSTDEETEV